MFTVELQTNLREDFTITEKAPITELRTQGVNVACLA